MIYRLALLKHLPGDKPSNQENTRSEVTQVLVIFYREQRGIGQPPQQRRKRSRINVVPGKSVAATNQAGSSTEEESGTTESSESSQSDDEESEDEESG
jgi:hypothetical protein